MLGDPKLVRCKCGGEPTIEPVINFRFRVRCPRCGTVELSSYDRTLAGQHWNDRHTHERAVEALRCPPSPRPVKSGEGAGDKLREDVP